MRKTGEYSATLQRPVETLPQGGGMTSNMTRNEVLWRQVGPRSPRNLKRIRLLTLLYQQNRGLIILGRGFEPHIENHLIG
jgi:hypothetical protein